MWAWRRPSKRYYKKASGQMKIAITQWGARIALGARQRSTAPRSCGLEVRNLTFTDDDGVRMLEGAYLVAPPGSKTCIVGSSGKDQSALLALILGLYRPERGSITVDGDDVASLALAVSRSTVALVLQDPWLVDGTVGENISFGHPGVSSADIEAVGEQLGLTDFISQLPTGYETVVSRGEILDRQGTSVSEITTGQRRRVALARALIRNPGVLLLEEPTTDLGVDEERTMIRAIDAASHGRTTVIATHRLSLARRCESVSVIEDGRIMPYRGSGPQSDHSRLWDLQMPPVVNPSAKAKDHLRVVGSKVRRAPSPTTGPWGITIGMEMAPGYLASGLLGRNAHTETWVAWSVEREEPARIRIPRQDPVTYPAFDQLLREYKALQAFSHPGLSTTFGADLEAEMPYAVFEYLDSRSLAKVTRHRAEGMEPLDILYTAFELAGAVNYMHQRGYVHLGIQAGSVRTREDTIVLTDFAHCQPIGTPLRPAAVPLASSSGHEQRFNAPECRQGVAADPKMDVYALGALMHRAAAGSVVTRVTRSGTGFVPFASLNEDSPTRLSAMVDRMLSPDPIERPNAAEVLSEFRRILPSSLVRPRVSNAAARSPRLRLVGANN